LFDGIGRKIQEVQHKPDGNTIVDTVYDALDRVHQVSNPYCSPHTTYCTPDTEGQTVTDYDTIGRVIKITAPGNAQTTITYSGSQTTTTDPNTHSRVAVSDALGRTLRITDADGSKTKYTYDVLDDLTNVQQGTSTAFDANWNCTGFCQPRQFWFNSLKRLFHAQNPENGDIYYTYDQNGNLTSRTDARSINTGYTYDALNRILTKTYTGGPYTPNVSYYYEDSSVANSVHQLTKISAVDTSVSPVLAYTSFYGPFDNMGRVLASSQAVPGVAQPYAFHYQYNQAGAMDTIQYPSGRTITTCYDTAGRPVTLSGVKSGTPNATYVQNAHYGPHSGAMSLALGNGLTESTTYNNRLQIYTITAGSLLTLTNGYGPPANNNGNLVSQSIYDGTTTHTQNYTYDYADRLLTATEGSTWSQNYLYDEFGNRALKATSSDPSTFLDTLLSIKATDTKQADPQHWPFDQTTNRWRGGTPDASGNLTDVLLSPNSFHATYDAENRQITTTSTIANVTTNVTYVYDGEGKRVQKINGTVPTTFVYDAMGRLAAEYTLAANPKAGAQYLTADHLGSTRLVTTGTGAMDSRSDYVPFGQEMPTSWGRSNYVADAGEAVKFTGQYRDSETGVDYFEARYNSGAQGRFMSPDPLLLLAQKLFDPQQWNMYSYVRNSPLRLLDPTGMYVCNGTKEECKSFEDARKADLKSTNSDVQNAATAYGDPGTDNGVTVAFGDPGKGNNGTTTSTLEVDPNNPGAFRARERVVIRKGLSGLSLRETLAHEGVHVENAQDFVATIDKDFHYDLSRNLTHWQTEMNAYAVSGYILANSLQSNQTSIIGACGTGQCTISPRMSAEAIHIMSMLLLANPKNGYNRFIDTGNNTFINNLSFRQFSDITTPNPRQ
jgi:RHS repeat-associated protein